LANRSRGMILVLLKLYKLSSSQQIHFSPEDRGSMFLRTVGICLQVHTALQPRRPTSTSSPPSGHKNSNSQTFLGSLTCVSPVIFPLGNEINLIQYPPVNIYLVWLTAVSALFSKSEYLLRISKCARITVTF
jgi:hypothetical protein